MHGNESCKKKNKIFPIREPDDCWTTSVYGKTQEQIFKHLKISPSKASIIQGQHVHLVVTQ